MKVRDQALWQERRAALSTDETNRSFLKFLELWAEETERRLLDAVTDGRQATVAEVLQFTLVPVEAHLGRCGAHFLGQMLALLAMHWEFGEDLMQGLTPIERRLVEDLTILKIASEQEKAEANG